MRKRICLVAVAWIAFASIAVPLQAVEPLHNPNMSLDVDNNHLVQPLDALIVINNLLPHETALPASAIPLASTDTSYYLDTSNDHIVSPLDALLVINHLAVVPVPEPGGLLAAFIGTLTLAGYAIRKTSRKSAK